MNVYNIRKGVIFTLMSSFSNYKPPVLDNPQFHVDELQKVPLEVVKYNGISSDHIDSGDDFIQNGIKQIIMHIFTIEKTMKNERKNT